MRHEKKKALLKVIERICEILRIEQFEIVQVLVEEDPDILCSIDVLEG